jgi:isorenieratene synthase
MKSILDKWIRRRLKDYRQAINDVDPRKEKTIASPRRVAVIGAGLAGIAASSVLAERGFDVTLFDKNSYIGGKVGSWEAEFENGYRTHIDHGFHAFFRHYYNLREFMKKIGSAQYLERINDYLILSRARERHSFADVETTPLLNIISLGRHRYFRFWDVLVTPPTWQLGALLRYRADETFRKYDAISFDDFAASAKLPPALKLVFATFARAFFAPADKISMAEIIKNFHFFYLSNNCGLLYDYFTRNYHDALLRPVTDHLTAHKVKFELGSSVGGIRYGQQFRVRGKEFDYVVLATDVVGVKRIAEGSGWIKDVAPETYDRLVGLESSNGYAVYRIWLDRSVEEEFPVFVTTEKDQILDSVTFCHEFDVEAARWVEDFGGGVYELHCYSVPPEITSECEVKKCFLRELYSYFPELQGAKIRHEYLQFNKDFTAFHTNLHKTRLSFTTDIENFYLAGDWVRIPTPAALMEGAFTSGLLCANDILAKNDLQEEPVFSVPAKGIFA